MQLPNFKELFQDNSLIEIEKYISNIKIAYAEFKETLFSEEVCEDYVRHFIDKHYKEGSIRNGVPAEIIYDSRTNRYQEDIYTFYCRDKKVLDDFIRQLCKDANAEYEDDDFNYLFHE